MPRSAIGGGYLSDTRPAHVLSSLGLQVLDVDHGEGSPKFDLVPVDLVLDDVREHHVAHHNFLSPVVNQELVGDGAISEGLGVPEAVESPSYTANGLRPLSFFCRHRFLCPDGLVIALGVGPRLLKSHTTHEEGQGVHGEEVDEGDLTSLSGEDVLHLDVHGAEQFSYSIFDDVLALGIFPTTQDNLVLVRVRIGSGSSQRGR